MLNNNICSTTFCHALQDRRQHKQPEKVFIHLIKTVIHFFFDANTDSLLPEAAQADVMLLYIYTTNIKGYT